MIAQKSKTTETFSRERSEWISAGFADITARYSAAKTSRYISKHPEISSGGQAEDRHYDAEMDYFRLVEIGRFLDRDDAVCGPAVTRLISNVLQCGFTVDPKTGDNDLDELIKLRWNTHINNPDYIDAQQERTLHELAECTLRDVIVAGDILAIPLNTLQLDLIENHRLRTPRDLSGDLKSMVVHGVRLNSRRQRLSYYITEDDISPLQTVKLDNVREIPARNRDGERQVWHLYYGKRISQTRGVTKFAACSDMARMHGDVQFAKLVQQQAVSAYTLVRERSVAMEAFDTEQLRYDQTMDPNKTGQFVPMQQMAPGQVYTTYPGERLTGFSPNVPSPTFFDHASAIQQLIAINLDLPLQLLLLDASQTNFSGWRGAIDQAKLRFKQFQKWFATRFYQQVYRWLVDAWSDPRSPFADPMITMARASGVDVFAHEWILPGWPYVQPLEDASADLMESRNALTSMRRVHMKRSADWTVVSDEIVQDNRLIIEKAIQAAQEITQQYGVEVNWQQLAALPMPDGFNVSVNTDAAGGTPQTAATSGGPTGGNSE